MHHDVRLRAAARAIYDACFTLAPIGFDEAGRRGTLFYHRAVEAAERARDQLARAEPSCS